MFRAEKRIRLLLDERVNQVETQGQRIMAVVAQNTRTARRTRITGPLVRRLHGRCHAGFPGQGRL